MAKASMMPASVEPCFETFTNISPGLPLFPGVSLSYSPTVTKPLQSPTLNSKVREARVLGSLLRTGRLRPPASPSRPPASPSPTLGLLSPAPLPTSTCPVSPSTSPVPTSAPTSLDAFLAPPTPPDLSANPPVAPDPPTKLSANPAAPSEPPAEPSSDAPADPPAESGCATLQFSR